MQRIKYQSNNTPLNEQIIELLCSCFGVQYRDYYLMQLEHLPTPQLTKMMGDEQGRLVAFTQVVDYQLKSRVVDTGSQHSFSTQKVAYLYSVCTAPHHQGQGIMRRFLDELLEELRFEGYAFAFLVPAEEWLVTYYKQFGFERQESIIYQKAPKNATPMIAPGELAQEYLAAVSRYEKKQEGQKAFERRCQEEWQPLLPAPIGWMIKVLAPEAVLPQNLLLLNPLT